MTEEPSIYYQVLAGTTDDPGIILTWGWGEYATAKSVGCSLLGRTADEGFKLLGSDRDPHGPCVSFDGHPEARITQFTVQGLAASTETEEERVLSETTTRLRSPA